MANWNTGDISSMLGRAPGLSASISVARYLVVIRYSKYVIKLFAKPIISPWLGSYPR